MHVETMSRSPIGMCLPLDQPPASSPTAHAFPPFPSPESECIPNWLQFDSLPTPTHYSNSYGAPVAIPLDNTQTSCALSSGERFLELDKNPCVDSWEDQQRPLPSFPQSLGRAKRRALDLACITRASPTGLHRPYSPTTFHSFSPPPPSGCYGHLSANNLCWAEQVSDNHVVVSQNEGLCMLVESQETYSRCEDYGNADSNVVMEILAEHNPFHQSCAESYPCHGIGMEGGVLLEEEEEEGGSREEDGDVEGRVGQWEETEEEEELDEEAVEEEEEKPVVEPVECGSRGAWKRGRRRGRRRRRKQSNESDGETATDDNVFLPEEDDGQCSLPSSPTTLICRWSDCNSIFGDQSALVRHIEKTHVDARSRGGGGSGGSSGRGCSGGGTGGAFGEEFACHWHLCPRRTRPFNARYKLLIHMRVHSGDKPNKCPYEGCPKAFSRLENLKIHQRSHTGERPYSCQFPLCPKAFSNSSDRAKHQRTHFDTKPYACQVAGCSKRYTDPSSLRKHVKNHSPKDQTQARRKLKSVEASSSPPAQNREPKSMSSIPQEMSYLSGTMQQDYNSEMSSSSASIKENAMDKDEFIDAVKMEGMSAHNLENTDGDYSQTDIIEYSSQTPEDELFFDCFQSLESIRPLLSSDKESVLTTDLQNSAQFELSLDLDCAEVQQDFLEIGVLEKWGVTGANIVGCTSVDDSLDSDFLTIS